MLLAAGILSVGLAAAGIVLPLLPTTPFLLLAAACYARSSRRIFNWLLNNPSFGPLIREWREYRAIPYRAKRIALILIALSFAISITFFVPDRPSGSGLEMMHGSLHALHKPLIDQIDLPLRFARNASFLDLTPPPSAGGFLDQAAICSNENCGMSARSRAVRLRKLSKSACSRTSNSGQGGMTMSLTGPLRRASSSS
jgi:uncharacterized membrane protein YbaN (DUF454 family)